MNRPAALLIATLAAMILASKPAGAQSLLDLSSLADLVAEKTKESRAAAFVTLDEKVAVGAYLPIWTFHGGGRDYVQIGIGGKAGKGSAPQASIPVAINATALSAALWSSAWASAHVKRAKFPPVWVGPYLALPLPGQIWTWKSAAGGYLSVGLGGQGTPTGGK